MIFRRDEKINIIPNNIDPNQKCMCWSWKTFRDCHLFKCLYDFFITARILCPWDLCFCWSWLKYDECCNIKIHPNRIELCEVKKIREHLINSKWKSLSLFNKTFSHIDTECIICWNEAISSHTVSKNRMKNIFKSDSCTTPQYVNNNFQLKKTSLKAASTFPIWCSEHDNSIFIPIDNWINLDNKYHLNLLAYRAIWREFKLKKCMVKQLYSLYYFFGNDTIWEMLTWAYLWMKDTFQAMQYIYYWIKSKVRTGLKHKVFPLWKILPLFASCAINPSHWKRLDKPYSFIIITIYTDINWEAFIVLSYINSKKTNNFIKKIIKEEKKWNIIPYLNKILSNNCENILCDESLDWEIINKGRKDIVNLFDIPTYDYIKPIK